MVRVHSVVCNLIFAVCGSVPSYCSVVSAQSKNASTVVIAHRGASGYAVEHTEAAKAMAFAQGAHFIEQDVVLSKDGQLVVTHDITMEETTDVELKFPARGRPDGRFYFSEFTWDEIQQLVMHERTRRGSNAAAIPGRFPGSAGQRLLRLSDEIRMIEGWNATTGRNVGLYIELKSPAFHKKELGKSMGEELLQVLSKQKAPTTPCFIQCFEAEELVELHDRLRCPYPLIFLLSKAIPENDLIPIARYARGIGPSLELIADRAADGSIRSTGLVEAAQKAGLAVHPYTVRKEAQPKWSNSIAETHSYLLKKLHVDGFFTDFPDLGVHAVESHLQSIK
ncbi:MAG: glycerophosphodiester phosphodiesterase family protein [Pirellula sp.]